ncbi:hypothetical protein [Thalassoroseus pseudoceratinae]|uniref:hypothetical protein n=1 Tax=Thalassoroseus pseudoceratinae TaxID=2713176 RepID=UPI0014248C88|nr:hypothetical protein [Thalassoroseus pseudoceratinae]
MSKNLGICLRLRYGVAVLAAGVSISLTGCSSNLHGPWQTAFSRFWGFDRASATLKSAPHAVAESFESMVESINRDPNAMDCSKDPFLDMQIEPSMQANPTDSHAVTTASNSAESLETADPVVQTLFENPPVEPTDSESQSAVQLAQHQQEVGEISSTENTLPVVTPGEPNSSKKILERQESSLADLKNALQEDARSRMAEKPPASDPALIRKRIDKMMQIANTEAVRGEYAIALRMAMAAQQLVDTSGVFFGPEEQKPADMVANLRARMEKRQQTTQIAQTETPADKPILSEAVPTPPGESESELEYTWKPATEPVSPVTPTSENDAPSPTDGFPQPLPQVVETEPEPMPKDPFQTPPTAPQIASRELTPGLLAEPLAAQRVQANQGSAIEVEAEPADRSEASQAPPFPAQLPLEQVDESESVFDKASEFAAVEKPIIEFVPKTPAAPEPPLPTEPIESPRNLLIDPSARGLVGQEPTRNVDWNDQEETMVANSSQEPNPWILPAGIVSATIALATVLLIRSRGPRR